MDNTIKLAIAIPTAGMVRMDFAYSVIGLVARLASEAIPSRPESKLEVCVEVAASSVIHGNRENLVQRAIENEKTHILFLDDDMHFDSSVANILFSRRQPVVACNYLIKNPEKDRFVAVGMDKKRVSTRESSTGLVPIMYSGFGVSLFEVEVFKKVPQPWFLPFWVAESKTYTTEDNPCYERIRNAGFPVYLDQDASKLVAHLGQSSWDWKEFKNG